MVFPNKVKIAYGKMRGWAVFGKIQPTLGLLPRIRGKVYLNRSGELQVGKRLNIIGKPWGTQLTVVKGARLTIGDDVLINAGVGIAANIEVVIGNNVMIGPRTSIFDSAYHRIDSLDDGSEMAQRITIQDNAWIGTGALILPGVTIGKNAVVAAGSTVTKDVPDNTLVAGAPAKVIRELTIHDGWIRR
ncbi:acetyltransferase [Paenibacillus sp. Root52]|uniref:Maltose O-acetyltransferase n=1 Tax=Paenibacillus amylolyticus TaxID=1451 RepID=A0AAP5LPH0_PAEAM|nr:MULTISPECIES: DapH/DapD/GlmU-related protein [Paenibacillus]KQY79602.1 acetyltransferase [Paenibacillus sp. Root52]MDR6724670.1 maltose O-acetyltransferase [Paenibacillus amylolyticus]